MTRINWDKPTKEDEARFAAAALAGCPIVRCQAIVSGKGASRHQCHRIARVVDSWKRLVWPTGGKPMPVEHMYRCQKHAGIAQWTDCATGQPIPDKYRSARYSLRDYFKENPDWR